MGVVKKTIHRKPTDPVLATPLVNSIMARARFESLLRFWHFSNNETAAEGDRLHKLLITFCSGSRMFSLLAKSYRLLSPWYFGVEDCFSGSIFHEKKHKYGVKLYLLCDPSVYVWNAIVYCGRSDVIAGLGHAEAVVMKLMEKRLDLGAMNSTLTTSILVSHLQNSCYDGKHWYVVPCDETENFFLKL